MAYLAAAIVTVVALMGTALTLVLLPGAWIAIAVAVACQLWQPELFSWWTLLACVGVALLGEIIELAASSLGAAKAGGSKAGAIGALVGALLGAVAGTFIPPPIIGNILGAALGAGLGAVVGEVRFAKRDWRASAKVGAGAAAGRLVAVVFKTAAAGVVAGILIVAAFVP